MTLTIPPVMERYIQEEAARHGRAPDAYALELLGSILPRSAETPQRPLSGVMTPQERARAYQQWAESHAYVTAPPLPDDALRRENMYEAEDSWHI